MTKLVVAFRHFANAPNKYHALETCGSRVRVRRRALRPLKEFRCTIFSGVVHASVNRKYIYSPGITGLHP